MFTTYIQETHLDFFGHVNNAKYLELFEQARWEAITLNGYGLDVIKETGQGPVILEVNLKYLKELKHRQKITIDVNVLHYKGKIGQLAQKMKNDKNEVCAELTVTFGLFDLTTRKLVEPTELWKKALGL